MYYIIYVYFYNILSINGGKFGRTLRLWLTFQRYCNLIYFVRYISVYTVNTVIQTLRKIKNTINTKVNDDCNY